jgi:hypothetical protein
VAFFLKGVALQAQAVAAQVEAFCLKGVALQAQAVAAQVEGIL